MKLFPFTPNLSRHNRRFINRAFAFAALAFCLSAAAPTEAATPTTWVCRPRAATVLQWPRWSSHDSTSYFRGNIGGLQYLLRRQGFYKSKPDGVFGPQTERAVKAFQRAKGLKADGIVGSETWPKLIVSVQRGSRGDAVRAVQRILRESVAHEGSLMNPTLKVDGFFGAETERAVRTAQEGDGMLELGEVRPRMNGVVGPQTWCVLVGGSLEEAKAHNAKQ